MAYSADSLAFSTSWRRARAPPGPASQVVLLHHLLCGVKGDLAIAVERTPGEIHGHHGIGNTLWLIMVNDG